MFELASIGMAQADPPRDSGFASTRRCAAITGYSADELLRMRIPEITHPDNRQCDWEAFQRVVRGETADYRLEKQVSARTAAWRG